MWFDPPAVAGAAVTDRWYPGERMARLRSSRSYGFVLLLVSVAFVFAAAAPDSDWSPTVLLVLQTATFAVAVWTSGLGRRAFAYALGLVGIAAALAGIAGVLGGDSAVGVVGIVSTVLVVATCVVVAVGVFDQQGVNAQSVVGAICIYLLIGMLFTNLYGAVAALGNGAFFAQGTDGTLSLRLYFSYVTLATLGYGDYTPAGDLGHTLAIVEALFGQLYLVTVVAVLVSRLGFSSRERGNRAGSRHDQDERDRGGAGGGPAGGER